MSRQRYAVTGVSRGIGTEIAMALRSRGHRVAGFDVAQMVSTISYISIFRTGVDHIGCVQDLAAARAHRMTDGELPWS